MSPVAKLECNIEKNSTRVKPLGEKKRKRQLENGHGTHDLNSGGHILNGNTPFLENSGLKCKEGISAQEANVNDVEKGMCSPQLIVTKFRKNRLGQKLVFLLSMGTLMCLACVTVYEQWFLAYYYTAAHPLLMLVRLVIYCKLKWQFYMLDLCYFTNLALLIYIWVSPSQAEYFTVLFSFAHGPVLLATLLFKNSLVLHSTDKMTSCSLHLLPVLLTFVLRWYPSTVSEQWYTPFVSEYTDGLVYMAIWLWAVPFAFYVAHMIIYLFLLKIVFRPSEEHDYSFKYLTGLSDARSSGGVVGKLIGCCLGPERMQLSYCVLTIVYGMFTFVYTPLLYRYFIANCVFIVAIFIAATWNAANYYVDRCAPKTLTGR